MVFIDSDLAIRCMQKRDKPINKKAREIMDYLSDTKDIIKMTAYNHAELIRGAYLSNLVSENMQAVENFIRQLEIVYSDAESIKIYAEVSATLSLKGEDVGDIDELISSVVIRHNDVLFSRNTDHFKRVPGLKVIDWSALATPPSGPME
jgi:tRNA(fMet)-specific endonuclease VapC